MPGDKVFVSLSSRKMHWWGKLVVKFTHPQTTEEWAVVINRTGTLSFVKMDHLVGKEFGDAL